MSVKVFFEIGHDSTLKAKPTPEGFTHDWELYVRGCENHDISHFVDKVVFNLHESFPKPKRVVKEAPYSIKESGYAGFVLTIDIYVKNREEPKKISFSYDLDLQQTGPTIQRKQSEKYIFQNPSEDFKRKLLKGGGLLMMNPTNNLDEKLKDDAKGKMSSFAMIESSKKHKLKPEDPFTNLFGTPITKTSTKVSPDPKRKASPNRTKPQQSGSQSTKSSGDKEKQDKESKSRHSKHNSPYREKLSEGGKDARKAEEKSERREEKKKDRSYSKDRDKSKEKSVKRPPSPARSPKRYNSPSRNSSGTKTDEKLQVSAATGSDKTNSSKKIKKEKKEKNHEKDKERKELKKDQRAGSEKAASKSTSAERKDVVKGRDVSQGPKDHSALVEKGKDTARTPVEGASMETATMKTQAPEKRSEKHERGESERKHKHKKKDKSGSVKEKKKDKSGNSGSRSRDDMNSTPTKTVSKSALDTGKSNPGFVSQDSSSGRKATTSLDKLYNELGEGLSSDSDLDSAMSDKTDVAAVGNDNPIASALPEVAPPPPPPAKGAAEVKGGKKSRDKKSSAEKKKKRSREYANESGWTGGSKESSGISKMDPPNKIPKRNTDDLYKNGDTGPANFLTNTTPGNDKSSYRTGENAAGNGNAISAGNPPLSTDYMSELKNLQQKIMTLQDNNELQQVVEMIAATGQYEITSKTFDFDLCALDKGTVQRLQEFFATS
uniref:YEATS domain-containing protein n=1 Tax=Lutzomyia longipalpis TaxID=7200 RepID=A0A1B0CFH7_LUTLO